MGRRRETGPFADVCPCRLYVFHRLPPDPAGRHADLGKRSPFDTIIIIMMGAILARGVIGASPFWSTVAASTTMVVINRIMAWSCAANDAVNDVIKGKRLLLYENGQMHWDNMKVAALSKSDLMESLRLETKQDSLEKIEKAYMETNGRISFLLKKST